MTIQNWEELYEAQGSTFMMFDSAEFKTFEEKYGLFQFVEDFYASAEKELRDVQRVSETVLDQMQARWDGASGVKGADLANRLRSSHKIMSARINRMTEEVTTLSEAHREMSDALCADGQQDFSESFGVFKDATEAFARIRKEFKLVEKQVDFLMNGGLSLALNAAAKVDPDELLRGGAAPAREGASPRRGVARP